MTVAVFGYLILISLEFKYFVLSVFYQVSLDIKHSRQCLTTFLNTSKLVKNTSLRFVSVNSILGVWKFGQTRSFGFDMLLQLSLVCSMFLRFCERGNPKEAFDHSIGCSNGSKYNSCM